MTIFTLITLVGIGALCLDLHQRSGLTLLLVTAALAAAAAWSIAITELLNKF